MGLAEEPLASQLQAIQLPRSRQKRAWSFGKSTYHPKRSLWDMKGRWFVWP